MNRQWILLFSVILLSLHVVSATVFLTASGNSTVQPGQNITIIGTFSNDTSETGPRPHVNISSTGNYSGTGNYSSGISNTTFTLNITAPSTTGDFIFNITSNSSDIVNRSIAFYVTNATTANVSYVGKFPPFTNGTTFTFKLTLMNGTTNDHSASNHTLYNNTPNVSIFISNGQPVSWTITALNTTTDRYGNITYNVTIPSSAATGTYVLVVEKGVFATAFQVSSGYVVAVNALSTADEVLSNFGRNATVNVLAKVRDANSNPVTVGGAYALVTLPNTTTRNVTLSSHPSSAGYYNNTFNETDATGAYSVKVVARVGTTEIEANSIFNVRTFTARMEPQKEFFFEWGGKSSFKPGEKLGLNIIVTDLTNDSVASSSVMDCGLIKVVDALYVSNSTSVNSTSEFSQAAIDGNGQYLLSNVCRFTLTNTPQSGGLYNVKLNVTYGGTTQTVDGFFSVSRYFMKAAPVLNLGGADSFMTMVTPGENVTLSVSARNTVNDSEVPGNEITNIVPTKLIPMEFKTGTTENTTVTYTVTAGTASANPTIELHVPANAIGPILVDIDATIGGEPVKGDSFFIANHLMGFMSPGGMGAGEEFTGGGFSSCSGNVTFSGMAMETKTMTAAQGVGIVGIIDARQELTGTDVSSSISVVEANVSGSDGLLKAKIEFDSATSFSGFYFMVFNASYKGKYAGIPAGFMCKKLNFFPQIQAVGSNSFGWRVAPDSNVTVTIQNIKRLNDSAVIGNQSNVTIAQIMNFNPGKGGMKVLIPSNPSTLIANVTKTGNMNSVSFNISPSDFTSSGQALTQWPNGFMDLQPKVCTQDLSPAGGACDTGFGGFEVTPFEAWTASWDFSAQVAPGDIKSYLIDARTNVSRPMGAFGGDNQGGQTAPEGTFYMNNGTSAAKNQTGFVVKVGKPWEGELTTVNANATLVTNGWNSTNDTFSMERWSISFQVPSTVKKGDTMVTITVNNSQGQSMDLMLFFQIVKYNVVVPSEDGVGDPTSGQFDGYFVPVDSQSDQVAGPQNTSIYGWNFTYLSTQLGANNVNSTSGRICFKNGFNATRYGTGGPGSPVAVNDTIRVAVVDRYSANTYDTVVLNNTDPASGTKTYIILNSTQRNFSVPTGVGGWYLWSIEDCGFFRGVNTSTQLITQLQQQGGNTWGGSYQVNTEFAIPYVVTLSNTPQSDVTVSVNGMGKQDNRGFGFESRLTGSTGSNVASGNNFSYTPLETDANGVAFLRINSTATGRLVSFWKINTSSGDTDTATMNSGTFFEVKAFKTTGDSILPLTKATVNLTWWNNSQSVWGAFSNTPGASGYEAYVYNGTITESSPNDFVVDGVQNTWYIVYGPTNNKTMIGTSTSQVNSSGTVNSTSDTIAAGSNSLMVDSIQGSISANNTTSPTILMHFFQSSPSGPRPTLVTSGTQNVSVKVCAETFDRPSSKPIEDATVQLYVQDWFAFPPTQKTLDMFELANHTNVTSSLARTGPSGCVALNVGPGQLGTWPQGKPLFIEGTITSGGNEEAVWVTDVFRTTVG